MYSDGLYILIIKNISKVLKTYRISGILVISDDLISI